MKDCRRVHLSEVCEIVSGTTPKTSVPEYWEGSLKWITPAELKEDGMFINDTNRHISKEAVEDSHLKLLPKGTVLFSSRAPIGKVAIADDSMYCNQGFKNMICNDEIDSKYLYFFLKYNSEKIKFMGRGATFKEISKSQMEGLEICLPSLTVQNQVTTGLMKIDELVGGKKKQLTLLEMMTRSRFIEMFGGLHDSKIFRYVAVGEVATVTSGGTPSRSKSEYWKNGSIPWIKTTELKNAEIAGSEEMITEEGLSNSSAKYIPAGSTLIAMYGQGKTRGMTGYLIKSMTVNQACAALVPNEHVNPKFLWHFMKLSYEKLRELAKGGNQPNLSINLIQRFPLLLPPINLQSRYVKFVDGVDKSKFIHPTAI